MQRIPWKDPHFPLISAFWLVSEHQGVQHYSAISFLNLLFLRSQFWLLPMGRKPGAEGKCKGASSLTWIQSTEAACWVRVGECGQGEPLFSDSLTMLLGQSRSETRRESHAHASRLGWDWGDAKTAKSIIILMIWECCLHISSSNTAKCIWVQGFYWNIPCHA